jgi:hypothetical protein
VGDATELVSGWPSLYREGEFSAHPLWQESWTEVHPILQAAFASP